jgi:hypothetical protein
VHRIRSQGRTATARAPGSAEDSNCEATPEKEQLPSRAPRKLIRFEPGCLKCMVTGGPGLRQDDAALEEIWLICLRLNGLFDSFSIS